MGDLGGVEEELTIGRLPCSCFLDSEAHRLYKPAGLFGPMAFKVLGNFFFFLNYRWKPLVI